MVRWSAWIKYYFHIDCEELDDKGNPKISDQRFFDLMGELQFCLKTLQNK